MAVPTHKRNESKVEFVNTAMELLRHTIMQTNRKFTNKDNNLVQELRIISTKIVTLVVEANSIYVTDTEDEKEKKKLLKEARRKLYSMSALLSIFQDCLKNDVSNYGWDKWGTLINVELKLLTGLIKK